MAEAIHIALIDDDAAVLDSLHLYFARREVETTCFPAAEAFLASLEHAASFDCVVSDVRMPGLSGLDLVRELRGRGAIAPIILITGRGDKKLFKNSTRRKWGACPHQLCRLPQAYRWGDLRRAGGELRRSVVERILHLQV